MTRFMAASNEKWIDSLQFSSLFWHPPQDAEQRKAQITAYVEYFGQFTSEQFPDDIAELIWSRYPSKENRLFDDVLATFVLHHPEHDHAVILLIISCIIDGTLEYDRSGPPFASFISLVCPGNEFTPQEITNIVKDFDEPGFLAPTGLFLGGAKYMIQGEPGAVIRGKKGSGGITVKKTAQALIFGIYEEPMTPGQCNMVVEKMGDYLIDQGL